MQANTSYSAYLQACCWSDLIISTHSDVIYPHFRRTDKQIAIVKFCLNYNISTIKQQTTITNSLQPKVENVSFFQNAFEHEVAQDINYGEIMIKNYKDFLGHQISRLLFRSTLYK